MSYMWAKSNFFVLQLYYNTVNSLGVQIFAKKQQINNMWMFLLSPQVNTVLVREDIYSFLEARILNPAQPGQWEPAAVLLKEARQQR